MLPNVVAQERSVLGEREKAVDDSTGSSII